MADKNLNSLNFGTGDTYYLNAGNVKYDPNETFASGTVGAKFEEQSQQIAALGTSKADKTALAKTDKRLDFLYELTQGIAWDFEEDHTEAYSKTVPAGAKAVAVNSVGGKSVKTKNLFDKDRISFYSSNNASFIWTRNDTKTRVRTTPIEISQFGILSNTPYVVSGMPENWVLGAIRCYTEYGGEAVTGLSTRSGSSFTITDSSVKYIHLMFSNDGSTDYAQNSFANANIQLEAGSSATPYEPYFDGIHSAEVQSVASNGKNLFDKNADIQNGYYDDAGVFHDSTTTGHTATYIEVDGSSRYYISGIRKREDVQYYQIYNVYMYDANKNWIGRVGSITQSEEVINLDSNCRFIRFQVSTNKYTASDLNSVQFEKGSSKTPYSPYGILGTLTIPSALIALEGYGESNGTDVNTVDFANKIYHEKGHYVEGVWTANVQDIDLTTILADFDPTMLCEAGGSITFEQADDTQIPVPNSTTYTVKLEEAVG